MKTGVIVSLAAFLLMLAGCEEKEPDEGLIDIAVKQEKQREDISRIASRMEAIESVLKQIQKSLSAKAPPSKAPEPGRESQKPGKDLNSTPEYSQIAARLSGIQQQLNLTQSQIAQMGEELLTEREVKLLAKRDERIKAMKDRPELSRGVDFLVQNVRRTIADADLKREFDLDVEELKQAMSELRTLEEFRQITIAARRRWLTRVKDASERQRVMEDIRSLEEASGDELAAKLQRFNQWARSGAPPVPGFVGCDKLLMELVNKYNIPQGTLNDSGLPAMLTKFESESAVR